MQIKRDTLMNTADTRAHVYNESINPITKKKVLFLLLLLLPFVCTSLEQSTKERERVSTISFLRSENAVYLTLTTATSDERIRKVKDK